MPSDFSPSGARGAQKTLRLNMRGDAVAQLQADLRRLSFAVDDEAGLFGPATYRAVARLQRRLRREPTGEVDSELVALIAREVTRAAAGARAVIGQVLSVEGEPVAGVAVQLRAITARRARVIANGRTDESGEFELRYQSAEPSLAVRVRNEVGATLAEQRIIDPEPVHAITLVTGGAFRGRPAFNVLAEQVAAALQAEAIEDAASLSDDEIDFVAAKHQFDVQALRRFVTSARLARDTEVSQAAAFALLSQSLPGQLTGLLAQDPEIQRMALRKAAADGVVSLAVAAEAEQTVGRLREGIVRHAFAPPQVAGKFSLGDLLGRATSLPRLLQERFVRRYVEHSGPVDEFWRGLRQEAGFGPQRVAELQRTLQFGALTWNHVPLVRALVRNPSIRSAQDLARLDEAAWRELLGGRDEAGAVIGAPPEIPGQDEVTRISTYASIITRIVEAAFPAAFFAQRLRADQGSAQPARADLMRFFDNLERGGEAFSFEDDDVDRFLDEHGAALDGVTDRGALAGELKRTTRLGRLWPSYQRYETIRPLLVDPTVSSARSIASRSAGTFVQQFGAAMGGELRARAVHRSAQLRSHMAEILFTQFSPAMHTANFAFLPVAPQSMPGLPNWEALFGSLDLCQCEHCNSILSPAAYFVDLLAFLRNEGLISFLLARRPDLAQIELSCVNTNTPLPYIDLVNEVLEQAVSSAQLARQTSLEAEVLRATPEHLNREAYALLATAAYPWRLPFDLAHEQACAYLERLDVRRHELMRLLPGAVDIGLSRPDIRIAAEHLGLGEFEQRVILGTPILLVTLRDFWGMTGINWVERLGDEARLLLQQSGLSYTVAQELFAIRFIDPGQDVAFRFRDLSCDLDNTEVVGLSEPVLDRMHRFVRLARRLERWGWQPYDLDRAISALGGALDGLLLVSISTVLELQQRLKAPLVDLLSWWAPLDTADYTPQEGRVSWSLYRRLFLNEALLDEAERAAFRLNATHSELIDGGHVREHAALLSAILSVSADDFALLRRSAPARITLDALSGMYRQVSLARALRLPLRDLTILRGLVDSDPFASPAQAARFVDSVEKIRQAGFAPAELGYLLTHGQGPFASLALPEGTVVLLLRELRSGLRAIQAQTAVPDEPARAEQALAERLALVLAAKDAITAMTIVRAESALDPGAQAEFVGSRFAPFADTSDLQAILAALASNTAPDERVRAVLLPLSEHLGRVQSRALVVERFADLLGLPTKTVAIMLAELLHAPGDPSRPALRVFLADSFVGSDAPIGAQAFGQQFALWTRVHKAGVLIARMALGPEELSWLVEHGTALDLLAWNALPVAEAEVFPALYPGWERLHDLLQLRRLVVSPDVSLFTLLGQPLSFDPVGPVMAAQAEAQFLGDLALATGWALADLAFLAGEQALSLSFPNHYRDGRAIGRMQQCLALMRRVGVSAPTLATWAAAEIRPALADSVKTALKARYDRDQWLQIAQEVNNPLREQRRDALVAFLTATRETFHSPDDLYAHFLIDPQMSTCMQTSRIKQAISSVQLFVQRVLLGLENSLNLAQDAAELWKSWMDTYRVWEANRKVFLYPENWLRPELRKGKTSLFKAVESWLLQHDAGSATAEEAVRSYLDELAAIAELDIVALYRETATGTHHIFGRPPDQPQAYSYRRFAGNRWSPWERVSLDIQSDHLIPLVLDGRLVLFWPIFSQSQKSLDDGAAQAGATPVPITRINLARSEYRDGAWGPVGITEEAIEVSPYPTVTNLSYYFRAVRRMPGPQLSTLSTSTPPPSTTAPIIFCIVLHHHVDTSADSTSDILPSKVSTIGAFRPLPEGSMRVWDRVSGDDFGTVYGRRYNDPGSSALFEDEANLTGVTSYVPDHTYYSAMILRSYVPGSTNRSLTLRQDETDELGNHDAEQPTTPVTILRNAPGRFSIAYPHQYNEFVGQAPFFFLDPDQRRRYFVFPVQHSAEEFEPPLSGDFTIGWAGPQGFPTDSVTPQDLDVVFRFGAGAAMRNASLTTSDGAGAAPAPFTPLLASRHTVLPSVSGSVQQRYLFVSAGHRFAAQFVERARSAGVAQVLGDLGLQRSIDSQFDAIYDPHPQRVARPYPLERVDFSSGAFATYNWELFFHIPWLVAEWLRQHQRYEEALRWFHYIFNPIEQSPLPRPHGCWKVLPFHTNDLSDPASQPIQDLLKALSAGSTALARQVEAWRTNPFDPHAIAELRIIAYQKRVVMSYLDTLIAWGDTLFRRDTIESINEATQLYILAASILGPRPQMLSAIHQVPAKSFNQLVEAGLDPLSNALFEIEAKIPYVGITIGSFTMPILPGVSLPALGSTLYFGVPPNEQLLQYWDTVADRLFKIRNCMNIEGLARQLPLFEPPIDPSLLVQAAAAGVDIDSILTDLQAPLPHYRFGHLLQKALEFCNEVKALGAGLLAALERQEGEELALLRAGQEVQLGEALQAVRAEQVTEAYEAKLALDEARKLNRQRFTYYEDRVKPDSDKKRLQVELDYTTELDEAEKREDEGREHERSSSKLATYVPDVEVGVAGMGPNFTMSIGRDNLIAYYQMKSSEKGFEAAIRRHAATKLSIEAEWLRREEEWTHQRDQADTELPQIDKQIAAATLRHQMALKEQTNQTLQLEHARAVEAVMRAKYTSKELYSWMISQLSAIYARSYQLAYDLAKRAERAFRHELGLVGSDTFIRFGYWDSLQKGLISSEKLHLDLRRMELAYLEQNRREYELTRHVSLALLDPIALLRLRETGQCFVSLPEAIFDLDCPGHYMRRIKSVGLSIPCVAGPYTSVNCTLTLLTNRVRPSSVVAGAYGDEANYRSDYGAIQSIVTSGGHNDSGLFEPNLRDERYLPFEGAGAISTWRLELPGEFQQFDYDTISDVIMHVRYTAREGGGALRQAAVATLRETALNTLPLGQNGERSGLFRLWSARHEFPSEWHRFLHPADGAIQTLQLDLSRGRLPYLMQARSPTVRAAQLFIKLRDGVSVDGNAIVFDLARAGEISPVLTDLEVTANGSPIPRLLHTRREDWPADGLGAWSLLARRQAALNANAIEDLWVLFELQVS